MKIRNMHFLAKSNIKGNGNSGTLKLLVCLLVVFITVVTCFTVTVGNVVDMHKKDYMARALFLNGWRKSLSVEAIEAIESIEHVEIVADYTGIPDGCKFYLTDTDDSNIKRQTELLGSRVNIKGLLEKQEKQVIKGKSLDETPVYSCLVPSIFYPYDNASNLDYKNLDYIDGTTLIGKTITVRGYNDTLRIYYNTEGNDASLYSEEYVQSPEFTLKVVGTYYSSYGLSGNFRTIYVSKETNLLMTKTAIENAGIDLAENEHPIAKWWNDPALHYYYVVVDDFSNIPGVFNKVNNDMGYGINSSSDLYFDSTALLLSNIFKFAGTFLTLAILFISVLLLIQSSVNSIRERKGFIGLMKAIGYKNHQIFASLIYEQLYMTLKAFLIGGAISTAVVLVANYFFKHGTYRQMQYIIDMKVFFIFLGVSFLIALLVPLVTQLLLLRKLVKIQPREAMNAK